jgi:dephospho-CoA kinase
MIYLIGLTGNIATGKSLVGRMLGELGAQVIDADALVRDLQRQDTLVYAAIVAEFGPNILRADGEIDRDQLGAQVFADPEALDRLEAIVHPAVGLEIERRLSDLSRARSTSDLRTVAVVEAIKLIEAGLHKRCNALWVVTSRPEVQLERLTRTRSLSEADARLRIEAQAPQSEKAALADVLIENNGTLDSLREQVKRHWDQLPARA